MTCIKCSQDSEADGGIGCVCGKCKRCLSIQAQENGYCIFCHPIKKKEKSMIKDIFIKNKMPTTGTLCKVYIVYNVYNIEDIVGVFSTKWQAEGYLICEDLKKDYIVDQRDAILYEDGERVSLFDPKAVHFSYELSSDYNLDEVLREEKIRKEALSKLTIEEIKSLHLSI